MTNVTLGIEAVGARVKLDLPYIHAYRDRHGHPRYYFRRKGWPTQKLDGEPGAPEFLASYNAALNIPAPRVLPSTTPAKPGSLDALRLLYLGSAEFRNFRPSTQRETRYVIDALANKVGDQGGTRYGEAPIDKLEKKHILHWRDGMANKPGAANKMLRVVKALLSFAVDRGFRKENPAFGIKPLKIGRFRSWTDTELIAFEARWPLGTLERTGYALAFYSAQRRGDLVKMKWTSIAGDTILLRQNKTGTQMAIPIHPELKAALAAVWPRREAAILTGARGNALNEVYFGAIMAEAIDKAGLPKECVLHGLRKAAARVVAETGGSVSSMTGHLSAQMEREYARDADQKRMSKAAVIGWTKGRRT